MIVLSGSHKSLNLGNVTVLGWKASIYKANNPWQLQSWRTFRKKKGSSNVLVSQMITQSQPFIAKKIGWTTHMLPPHQQFYMSENDNIAIRVDNEMPLYEHDCAGISDYSHNAILNFNAIPIEKENIKPGLIVEGHWNLTTCKKYSFELITRRQPTGKSIIISLHEPISRLVIRLKVEYRSQFI